MACFFRHLCGGGLFCGIQLQDADTTIRGCIRTNGAHQPFHITPQVLDDLMRLIPSGWHESYDPIETVIQ